MLFYILVQYICLEMLSQSNSYRQNTNKQTQKQQQNPTTTTISKQNYNKQTNNIVIPLCWMHKKTANHLTNRPINHYELTVRRRNERNKSNQKALEQDALFIRIIWLERSFIINKKTELQFVRYTVCSSMPHLPFLSSSFIQTTK